MSALPPPPELNPAAKKWIPVLIIGILGLFGSLAIYYFTPTFFSIDLLMMLVIVFFVTIGYNLGIVRGVLTIVIVYLSTAFSAMFYRNVAPYVGALLRVFALDLSASVEDGATRGDLAFTFMLLAFVFWLILEILSRIFMEDTKISSIGVLDNLGGVVVYFLVGVLVAALLFNAIGYGRLRSLHNVAGLRRPFNQVLYLFYNTQSFWFGRNPPPLYTYDLNAR